MVKLYSDDMKSIAFIPTFGNKPCPLVGQESRHWMIS